MWPLFLTASPLVMAPSCTVLRPKPCASMIIACCPHRARCPPRPPKCPAAVPSGRTSRSRVPVGCPFLGPSAQKQAAARGSKNASPAAFSILDRHMIATYLSACQRCCMCPHGLELLCVGDIRKHRCCALFIGSPSFEHSERHRQKATGQTATHRQVGSGALQPRNWRFASALIVLEGVCEANNMQARWLALACRLCTLKRAYSLVQFDMDGQSTMGIAVGCCPLICDTHVHSNSVVAKCSVVCGDEAVNM
jgi:hypothetical protein